MTESSFDDRRHARAVLEDCSNDHCQRLYQFLIDDEISINQLHYEDVFYPLRHHHDEGLVLETTRRGLEPKRYVWGPGDLIYRANDDVRDFSTAVEPWTVFDKLDHNLVDVDVVADPGERREADDD